MAVLMTLEVRGGTTAQYDRTNEILGIAEEHDAPPGLVAHVCAVTDDGIVIVDVWDSVNSLDDFAQGRLRAAFAEAEMPEATPRVLPVHRLLFGAGKESNVLVLLDAPGLTTEAYDALVARMPAHAGSGENHPAVLHVAALETDGHIRVADIWDSEAAFGEFVQSELGPAVGDPRHFVLRVWPVYNRLFAQPGATA
jgi:hypothetical protein